MRNKIKAVTFDFGGTIALGELDMKAFANKLLEYLRSIGFSGSESRLSKARSGMLETLMRARRQNREVRFEDLHQGLFFKLGLHPEREAIDHVHDLYIRSFEVEFVPGVKDVFKTLREKYRLAVISNAMSNVPRQAIKKIALDEYLDALVVSRDLGIRKPDPEIFNFALRNIGVESKEAIHIGDSMKHDIQGAKNAGMKAVWIRKNFEEIIIQPDHIIRSLRELFSIL